MELNKDTRIQPSKLFDIQLKAVSDRINDAQQSGKFFSVEDALLDASSLLSEFNKNLGRPIGTKRHVLVGALPDVDLYNENLTSILANLEILFESVDDLEQSIVSSFNYIVAESDRIAKETRQINSMLLDYGIYTDSVAAGIIYYADSFNDVSKIESDVSFLNTTKASLNYTAGAITLAKNNEDSPIRQVSKITINEASNGTPGNNHQINANINEDINKVLDSNPDTWFEYEAVTNENTPRNEPVTLDIVLELEEISAVNNIVIDPNNFGTKNPVKIEVIETSIDGSTWTTIETSKFALDFLHEKKEDEFELSSKSSKHKGKGVFSFFPRSIKYLHIVLRQYDYYPIETSSGTKIRYAIGIKDIEIYSNTYEKESEIVSKRFYAPSEIKKVSLQSSEIKEKEVALATVTHSISPDDGITWHEIQPRNIQVAGKPEILNFNTVDEDSINTSAPVDFIRYKINLKRNDKEFSSVSSVLSSTTKELAETFNVSDKAPLLMTLSEAPIPSAILVLDPIYGSVGNDSRKKTIGVSSGEASQQFALPWNNFERDAEQIWVGGSIWTRKASFTSSASIDTHYTIDYELGILRFGDGTKGAKPISGSRIEINFEPERIWIEKDRISRINFDADADKANFAIHKIGQETSVSGELLKKGATIHRFNNSSIKVDSEFIDESAYAFQNKQTYIDGKSEITSTGDYSINYRDGIMYSYDPADDVASSSISYLYTPKTELGSDEWDFYSSVEGAGLKNQIQIADDSYSTTLISEEAVTQDVRTTQLSNGYVEPGSIKFKEEIHEVNNPNGKLTAEVAYIDGITELTNLIQISGEDVPSAGNLNSNFQLKAFSATGIELSSDPRPVFSNHTVFDPTKELVYPETPDATGEYSIDYNNSQVYVYDIVPDSITVSYYYSETLSDMSGKYSIDYKNGIIYSYEEIYQDTIIDYEFSNYEVVYNISRIISDENYYYDAERNSVVVSDNEVIETISKTRETSFKFILKVLYDYVDKEEGSLAELEPYYTPYVDGYSISIVDKDNII